MHELQFDRAEGVMQGLLVAETIIEKILDIISVFEAILLC